MSNWKPNIGGIAAENEVDRAISGRASMHVMKTDNGDLQIDYFGFGGWERNISIAQARAMTLGANRPFKILLDRHFGDKQK